MAFCKNCGAEIGSDAKFCLSCGVAVGNSSGTVAAPMTVDQKDAEVSKVMAILAYIIVLIPLFAARDSKFARYHTNQGLILAILGILYAIAFRIINAVLLAISWRLALAVSGIIGLVSWAFLIWAIIGIIHASKGEMKPLPLIGGVQILK